MFKILLTTGTSECEKQESPCCGVTVQTHTIGRELCQRLRRLKMAMHGTLGTPPLAQAYRSSHLSLKKQAQSSGKCLTISPAPFPALPSLPSSFQSG